MPSKASFMNTCQAKISWKPETIILFSVDIDMHDMLPLKLLYCSHLKAAITWLRKTCFTPISLESETP